MRAGPRVGHCASRRPEEGLAPNRRLLRPRGVLIALFERLTRWFQRRGLPRRFVACDTGTILRPGGGLRVGQFLHDLAEATLGIHPLLLVEREAGAAKH